MYHLPGSSWSRALFAPLHQIAMDRTRGNLAAAVEGLRRYLEVHAADREAWEELGELYLEVRVRVRV